MTDWSNWENVGAAIVVLCLVVSIIEFTRWWCERSAAKQPPPIPECLGSEPGPQQRAENDCENCSHEAHCMGLSRFKRRQRARDAERTSPTDSFIPVSLRPRDE